METKELPAFLKRMVTEAEELGRKTIALNAFMEGEVFKGLDKLQKDLMQTQFQAMCNYFEALRLRILHVHDLQNACGKVCNGYACTAPKGAKCPDCGPAAVDYPAGE